MNPPVEESAISALALFSGLDERETSAAARSMRKVVLSPKQVLFGQGDPGDTLYVLVTGRLDVYGDGLEKRHHLATLEPGTILGHVGLLANQERSATVMAGTTAELWEVGSDALQAALEVGEVWAGRFLLAAARQLAVLLGVVSKQVIALTDEAGSVRTSEPASRVVELEELRRRLFMEWAF